MPSLSDLSAELKLAIIEQLEPLEEILVAEERQEKEEAEQGIEEGDRSRNWPLLNLSCTCKLLRILCAPYVFKWLVLADNEKSATSIQAVGKNIAYAECVRSLRFKTNAGANTSRWRVPSEDDPKKDLTPCVESVLGGLKVFPNLEHLGIRLLVDTSDWEMYPDSDEDDWDDWACVKAAEANEPWRALMQRTYAAIARNHDHGALKHLEIVDMVAKPVSSWEGDGFKELLQKLESFTVSLMGGDNGAGWCMNTNEWYTTNVGRFCGLFLGNMPNLKHLSLTASEEGPVGLEGFRHVPLPLETLTAPLQSLILTHNFVSASLAEFIARQGRTLERIQLKECYSGANCSLAENAITWTGFFGIVARAAPPALVSFEVSPIQVMLDMEYSHMNKEEGVRVMKALQQDPEKHLFAYNTLDDKYGMLFQDDETMIQSYDRGEDQAAFDRLMEVVRGNVARKNGE
ncbi:hypothetical protein BCR34DRAFT_597156 [Clohesyomyces aquaticus]|uniref:F-box domain-containing protein n=1 Tax=Clohesyomyces aquaticus TaxID=1231657 RepID=A0A1Y2A3L7_9PLEO|nr:hypothetical protein BCR34DRAFT_597156 [Clohesyomyces aquaticus]